MIEQHRKGRSLKRHCGAGFLRLTNYTFSWQDTFWVVLDGNKYLDWSEKALRNWLLSVLESSDATWKFVTFHQPGFSDDVKYGRDQRMRMIADVLEKGGVDIVFSGHCHFYQRHRPLQFTPLTKRPLPDGTVTGTMTIDREFDGVTMTSPEGSFTLSPEPAESWLPIARPKSCLRVPASLSTTSIPSPAWTYRERLSRSHR